MAGAIGCPTRSRGWIVQKWMSHTAEALRQTGETAVLVFAVSEYANAERDLIFSAATLYAGSGITDVIFVDTHEDLQPDVRQWDYDRYSHMASIRNTLLQKVRELRPRWFWSLDSDILAHPQTLVSALELLPSWGAVGTRCYMDRYQTPSYAQLGQGLVREDSEGVFRVDVIMASKVMSPMAYSVDYVADPRGEDIGWALACRRANVSLCWDGRTLSNHVMEPQHLEVGSEEEVEGSRLQPSSGVL